MNAYIEHIHTLYHFVVVKNMYLLKDLIRFLRSDTCSCGVTAGQFVAMSHLKLKFLPNFQSRLEIFFWNL
jgi:hypothetical protein